MPVGTDRLPTFVHVDPSLQGVGGHEHEGALNILQAAESAGYRVALAASSRFRGRPGLPDRWPIYSFFPRKCGSKFSVPSSDCIALDGSDLDERGDRSGRNLMSTLANLGRLDRSTQRRRQIDLFAKACRQLFGELGIHEGDHVFFQTITIFQMLGLVRYLAGTPRAQMASWHLQVHDDPLQGCEPSEKGQRRTAVRRQLEHILRQVPERMLQLYAPTVSLAREYTKLGVADFRHLPHPVCPTFQNNKRRTTGNPLRVTCAGGVRREKGYHGLRTLVSMLRGEPAMSGKLELVAQLSKQKLRRLGLCGTVSPKSPVGVPLKTVPHPLPRESYRKLIQETDIGLFLYGRNNYRFRCSAVLQEMLAAGKPVIVPAGTWLADQIAEPNSRYLEKLQADLPAISCLRAEDIPWRRQAEEVASLRVDNELSFTDSQCLVAELPAPDGATELLLSFRRRGNAGHHIRVQTEQRDIQGIVVNQFDTIVGKQTDTATAYTLHRVDPECVQLTLRLSNAYTPEELTIHEFRARFQDSRATGGSPLGSVGLSAARVEQLPTLLHDMIEHFNHYRTSAAKMSDSWCQTHAATQVVETLTMNSAKERNVVNVSGLKLRTGELAKKRTLIVEQIQSQRIA